MKILISGVVNLETSLKIEKFPIEYNSLNFVNDRISSNLGGVGFNITKALKTLGSDIRFFTLMGKDFLGEIIDYKMRDEQIDLIKAESLTGTPQSVVIYDKRGERQINTDLKDIHLKNEIEAQIIEKALENVEFGILTNVIYSKVFVSHMIKKAIPFATDLQAIDHYSNEYNKIFIENAEILFLSNDNLKCREEEFIEYVLSNHKAKIVCVGKGKKGLIIGEKNGEIKEYEAPKVEVVNSIGAGDALFSSFIHFYLNDFELEKSIKKALIFVGEKIKTSNSALGFSDEEKINKIYNNYFDKK